MPKMPSNLFSIFPLDRRFSSVFFRTRYVLTRQKLIWFCFRHTLLHAKIFHFAKRICLANFEREVSKNIMELYAWSTKDGHFVGMYILYCMRDTYYKMAPSKTSK